MVRFRPGTAADSRLAFDIFVPTIDALGARVGGTANATAGPPDLAWLTRRPLFEHLAATFDAWWFAVEEPTGRPVGYARSIVRDGVRELTEFFVLPDAQGLGIGRGLLERAFPPDHVRHRSIIATTDPRAIASYLGTGLAGRVPMAFVEGPPRPVRIPTDLVRSRMDPADPPLDELGRIDQDILGFRRDVDHRWLMTQRPAWAYRRDGRLVAYAYHPVLPAWGGPYAAVIDTDLPVLLADAETAAAEAGQDSITFDMALTATTAWNHVLARGLRVDAFTMLYFTDGPVDGLDRYVLTSPPFFA